MLDRSLAILGSVADALDSAHAVGLIHRDVKPQNILVGARDHAYLADFGLTKAAGEGRLTATGQFIGTIDYVAPEQVQGEDASARSDVYSLTGVFHECLTGVVPFSRTTEAAVLYAHISDPPPKVSEQRPDLPEALDEVIASGMAKQPDERYATAGELLRAAAVALGQSTRSRSPGPRRLRPATRAGPGATVQAGAPTAESPQLAGALTAPHRVPTARGVLRPRARAQSRARPSGADRHSHSWRVATVAALAAAGLCGGQLRLRGGGERRLPELGVGGQPGTSFPANWERLSEQPGVPGIRMSDPIVLAPGSGRQGQLAAGMVAAGGATLLPASFRKLLPEQPAPDDPVTLGDVEAYRYEGLRPEGLDGPSDPLHGTDERRRRDDRLHGAGPSHGAARRLRGGGHDARVVRREGVPARPQRGLRQVAGRGIRRARLGAGGRTRPRCAGPPPRPRQARGGRPAGEGLRERPPAPWPEPRSAPPTGRQTPG